MSGDNIKLRGEQIDLTRFPFMQRRQGAPEVFAQVDRIYGPAMREWRPV